MDIPTFINVKYTEESGYLTPAFQYYNDQLNQALSNGIGPNGFTVSILTTAQIAEVEPNVPNGTTWFNSTLGKLQVKVATGTIETITSS